MTRWLLVLATGCWTSSTPAPVAPPSASPPTAVAATADASPAPEPPHRTFHDQQPITRPPSSGTSQADLSNRLNSEGAAAFAHGAFAEASSKFREAVARVPETFYFFNLCVALYNEGKFTEALTACQAGRKNSPSPELDARLGEQIDQILDEAARQKIELHP